MSDTNTPAPETSGIETPAQKALRLKKAAASGATRPGSRLPNERAAAHKSLSQSKPALKK